VTHQNVIIRTSSIKPNGRHEFEHAQKMDGCVYECIKSMKRRIDEDPATPVSILYEQEVKKFRRENGTAGLVPVHSKKKGALLNPPKRFRRFLKGSKCVQRSKKRLKKYCTELKKVV
jgi:hypothetical protein